MQHLPDDLGNVQRFFSSALLYLRAAGETVGSHDPVVLTHPREKLPFTELEGHLRMAVLLAPVSSQPAAATLNLVMVVPQSGEDSFGLLRIAERLFVAVDLGQY